MHIRNTLEEILCRDTHIGQVISSSKPSNIVRTISLSLAFIFPFLTDVGDGAAGYVAGRLRGERREESESFSMSFNLEDKDLGGGVLARSALQQFVLDIALFLRSLLLT